MLLVSKIAIFSAPFIHCIFAIVDCVVFPENKDVQKMLLGKHFESPEALTVLKLILFNLGAYNALLASATLYGIFFKYDAIVEITLMIYVLNGFVLLLKFPSRWGRALLQITPPLVAMGLPNTLNTDYSSGSNVDMPAQVISFCILLHILFFVAESLLFGSSKSVQKVFLGKLAKAPAAIEVASGYFFCQGVYNLCLALGTIYALFVAQDEHAVKCFLAMYVGAALALVSSSPKLYRGAILQGGPALAALYLMWK